MEEHGFALSPINFFQISADCHALAKGSPLRFPTLTLGNMRKYLLPDTSALCSEEQFANVALGWHAEGIEALVEVHAPLQQPFYPELTRGDSLELFVDTRDVKTSGVITRFCHHFFFLPEAVEGQMAGEITRFRSEEEAHPLCDATELKTKSKRNSHSYLLQLFIPSHCLYGYDPEQFDRLGFSYRVNRLGKSPQHFSVTTEDYQIEQHPSLWGSLRLIKQAS